MPAEPRSRQMLDHLDTLIDEATATRDELADAMADGVITLEEARRIQRRANRTVDAVQPVVEDAAHADAVRDLIGTLNNTWAVTPKVQRKWRETVADLARIESGRVIAFPSIEHGPEAA